MRKQREFAFLVMMLGSWVVTVFIVMILLNALTSRYRQSPNSQSVRSYVNGSSSEEKQRPLQSEEGKTPVVTYRQGLEEGPEVVSD